MLLALDTATRTSGIALFDGRALIAELNWHSSDGQTSELMPRLVQLMAWHGLQPPDLACIAVSLGPGSFTGLRVALSAAKGMALAHQLPLVGVPTLDATAFPHVGRAEPVCAIVEAGRSRVYWATYRPGPATAIEQATPVGLGPWQGWHTPAMLSTVEEMATAVHETTVFAGELVPEARLQLGARLGALAVLAPPTAATRRAGYLAELGWRRWQEGQVADPASLSPIYLREP
jgi:tRNA threonylcarbamoyladenosine biosynthesis protein TsaB